MNYTPLFEMIKWCGIIICITICLKHLYHFFILEDVDDIKNKKNIIDKIRQSWRSK